MSVGHSKVFLSHNSVDKPSVVALARRLEKAGIGCWLDDWEIPAGGAIDEAIEEALEDCHCCLVFVGSHGLGPWHREEVRAWLWDTVGAPDSTKLIIAVLLPGATADDAKRHLPIALRRRRWVPYPSDRLDDSSFELLVRGIRGETPRAAFESVDFASPVLPPVNLPYLCDRIPQEDELRGFVEAAQKADRELRRPLLFLLHGPAHEAHIPFLERLERRDLPRWLGYWRLTGTVKGRVKRLALERPLNTQDPAAFAASYRSRIASGVDGENPCESDSDLIQRLIAAGIGLAAPTLELSLAELFAPEPKSYLDLIRDYWANFPELVGPLRIFAFVAVKTPATSMGTLGRVQALLPWTEEARTLRRQSQLLGIARGLSSNAGIPSLALPVLTSAEREDVSRWSQHPEVVPRLPQYLTDRQLDAIFDGRTSLPMDDAIDQLSRLILTHP